MILYTLGPSHFAEKARWALDRAQLRYRERCLAPGRHRVTLGRFGAKTVPVLDTKKGEVLRDSSEILRWVDARLPADRTLFPAEHAVEIARLEDEADEGVGPCVRAWVYSWLSYDRSSLVRVFNHRLSFVDRVLLGAIASRIGPVLRRQYVRRKAEPAHYDALVAAWSRFDALLADGRRYLVGDRFTAADLAFASLGAHVVGAARFVGGRLPLEAWPEEHRKKAERLRETPAGRHVLRMYEERQ